jgi:hypothetical protein
MNTVLRLRGQDIDGGTTCCLRSQLACIVKSLMSQLGEVTWYAADVDVFGTTPLPPGDVPMAIGTSQQLLDAMKDVNQFLRGVFLAVKPKESPPRFRPSIDTEDPVDVELGDAEVELRTLDTTYFEILTTHKGIADRIVDRFGKTVVADVAQAK